MEGNAPNQSQLPNDQNPDQDKDQNKLVLKFHDDVQEFNISDETGRKQIVELAQKGLLWDRVKQTELRDLKAKMETLNNLFDSARTNDEAFKNLVSEIERLTGRKITQESVQDDSELTDEEKKIRALENKIEQMSTMIKNSELKAEMSVIENELASLEKKYDGSNGYPSFDRVSVVEFANQNGLVNYEQAYMLMNVDKIAEAKAAGKIKKTGSRQQKIANARVQDTADAFDVKPKIKNPKSYNDITESILDYASKNGITFSED